MGYLGKRSAHTVYTGCRIYRTCGLFFPCCVPIYLPQGCIVPAVVVIEKDIVTTTCAYPERILLYVCSRFVISVLGGPSVDPGLSEVNQRCQILISAVRNVWVVPYIVTITFEIGELKSGELLI